MKRIASTPAWLQGPIVVAGNWEPLIYRRRLNCLGTDGEERYRKEHTPKLVSRLKEAGVNLLVTHYFKGFGLKGEREDMELAEKLIGLCHEQGIRVAGYVGDTFVFETLLLEEPDAMSWCQRKADGTPLTYGGNLTYRLKWCRNNPAFPAYMKRVLQRGIEHGLDMIHFDNFLNKPEPKNCRCPHCTAKFRAFLLAKYSAKELKERLGFSDLTHVLPPTFTDPLYVCYGDDVIQNPLLQEWVDFRCQTLVDSLRDLVGYCRSLKPDIVIDSNSTGIWGENSANLRSVDHVRLLPLGHFFWDESPNPHGLQRNGALPTSARSMKMGETLGNRVLFYCFADRRERVEMKAGEAFAFNGGCLGMVSFLDGDTVPAAGMCRPYVDFLNAHAGLLCGTGGMARLAVYRNFPSLAYNAWGPHVQSLLAEQTLLQNHVPFDLVFDPAGFGQYAGLVIAGLECLSDDEIRALRRYVERGGRAILIGDVGTCDSWRRPRPVAPFADAGPSADGIVRLPPLELPAKAPGMEDRAVWDNFYRVVDGRFWMLPSNARALLAVLDREAWAPFRVFDTNLPATSLAEPRLCADGRTRVVHIINYSAKSLGRRQWVSLPGLAPGAPVQQLGPGAQPRALEARSVKGRMRIEFPNDRIYSLIRLP